MPIEDHITPTVLLAPLRLLPDYKESKAFTVAEEVVEMIYATMSQQNPSTRRRDVHAKEVILLTLLSHLGIVKEHRGMDGLDDLAIQIPFRDAQVKAFGNIWKNDETEWWFTHRNLAWVRDGLQLIDYLGKPDSTARKHRNHIKGQHLTQTLREVMRTRLLDLTKDYPLAVQERSAARAIRALDAKILDSDHPIVKRFREVLYLYNEAAAKNSMMIDGYAYPMTLRVPWHDATGKLITARLKWGVRLYADHADLKAIPDKFRPNYQCFGEAIRLDANRYVHPHGELVEIDIKASQLGIVKHLLCGDKSPWKNDPYREAIFAKFPWLDAGEVELIRREMKHVCGSLGIGTTGKLGACRTYTLHLHRGKRDGEVRKASTLWEGGLRHLLRISRRNDSVSTVLWNTFYNTMPEKMRTYMHRHPSDLHVVVQGIEGQIMLNVIEKVGRWTLPLVMHDGILVLESCKQMAIDALKESYRTHTKGGQVVYTVKHQHIQ